jgi:hypothetical protein
MARPSVDDPPAPGRRVAGPRAAAGRARGLGRGRARGRAAPPARPDGLGRRGALAAGRRSAHRARRAGASPRARALRAGGRHRGPRRRRRAPRRGRDRTRRGPRSRAPGDRRRASLSCRTGPGAWRACARRAGTGRPRGGADGGTRRRPCHQRRTGWRYGRDPHGPRGRRSASGTPGQRSAKPRCVGRIAARAGHASRPRAPGGGTDRGHLRAREVRLLPRPTR